MIISMEISGMKCNGCKDQVTEILQRIKNVKSVDVNLNSKIAVIETDKPIKEIKIKKLFVKTPYTVETIKITQE